MINHFEHPWFLLIFGLALFLLIFRRPKYFLRHAYLPILLNLKKQEKGRNAFIALPIFLKWLGWSMLILAASGFYNGYKMHTKKAIIHKYILINDGSGSMVEGAKINGVGRSLSILLQGNEEFLKTLDNLKRSDDSKDFVGATVFSNDPFVVSYLTEDYDLIRKKLAQIDWRVSPALNGGTEINKAIWLGVKMILKKNGDSGRLFFSENELISIETRLMGSSRKLNLDISPPFSKKISDIKKEIRGSALVLFTDGIISLDGDKNSISVPKVLLFCKEEGIRVYLISVEQIPLDFLKYIKLTDGEGVIVNNMNLEKVTNAYKNIVSKEAGEYEVVDLYQKKSYSVLLAGIGLALLLAYTVIRNSIGRSFTNVGD